LLQDPLDRVNEAHAQHLIGLIEHHILQRAQAQRAVAWLRSSKPLRTRAGRNYSKNPGRTLRLLQHARSHATNRASYFREEVCKQL
jgi:hypothetical protein